MKKCHTLIILKNMKFKLDKHFYELFLTNKIKHIEINQSNIRINIEVELLGNPKYFIHINLLTIISDDIVLHSYRIKQIEFDILLDTSIIEISMYPTKDDYNCIMTGYKMDINKFLNYLQKGNNI